MEIYKGYYELNRLIYLEETILRYLQGDYYFHIPNFTANWTCSSEGIVSKKASLFMYLSGVRAKVVKMSRIVLADLFNDLFPSAKWIYISRNVSAMFASRFGASISYPKYVRMLERRFAVWNASVPAKKALYLQYEEFSTPSGFLNALSKIAKHLSLSLTTSQIESCTDFWRPRTTNLTKNEEASTLTDGNSTLPTFDDSTSSYDDSTFSDEDVV